jgi:exocyst complex component 1
MHSFVNDLSQQSLGSMAAFTRRAETIYDENLSSYVRLLLRRSFQKLMDFVEGSEKLLQTQAPIDVASNSSYNKGSLKKVIKDNTSKDIRRNIDALFKRVEKHFGEGDEAQGGGSSSGVAMPGTVLFVVWKACEDEMINISQKFFKFISTCHKDSNPEYSIGDIEASFKKHRA